LKTLTHILSITCSDHEYAVLGGYTRNGMRPVACSPRRCFLTSCSSAGGKTSPRLTPKMSGRIMALRIEGDQLVQAFGAEKPGTTKKPSNQNYSVSRRHNVVWRLTMTDTDVRMADADPADPFDFFRNIIRTTWRATPRQRRRAGLSFTRRITARFQNDITPRRAPTITNICEPVNPGLRCPYRIEI